MTEPISWSGDWKPIKLQYCFVATCKNSTTATRKRFFKVPYENRSAWCRAGGRTRVLTSSIDICEDHLQLQEDVENYTKWMNSKVRPKLRSRVPSKLLDLKLFEPKHLDQSHSSTIAVEDEPHHHFTSTFYHHQPTTSTHCWASTFTEDKSVHVAPQTKTVGIQKSTKSVSVSTLTKTKVYKKNESSTSIEQYMSSISTSSKEGFASTPSLQGSTDFPDTDSEKSPEKSWEMLVIENSLKYLGIPKNYTWLIDYIHTDTKVPKLHIITVLYKIRQSDPFYKIADLFKISEKTLTRMFPKTLDLLASVLGQFIYWPTSHQIKSNLPLTFRAKPDYANTQSIIDCFEVEIQKPSDPIHQSLTWSAYKSCNTVKFLISATPDGFINFVSKGYGGRISDMKLVEISGYLDVVKPNSTVLADRGFKHLETVLQKKNVKLVRPPSVQKNIKMTKSEAIETKIIASLRIHIERVIRRVRLYKLLKPHSTIDNKLVNQVDNVVRVACGLINLHSPIIKM